MINRFKALARATELYNLGLSDEMIERRQLQLATEQWERALARHAFYRWWQREHDLPNTVSSIQEIRQFPLLDKKVISSNYDLVFAESDRRTVYTTGGTTAEPTLFPAARYEVVSRWADNYVGRRWWGIEPFDKSLLVWGHSHLYGRGLKRQINRARRRILDGATRTLRVDGYVTSKSRIAHYVDQLIRYRPTHVIGYSTALARLAAAASEQQSRQIQSLRLKGAVATAERLDEKDQKLIEKVLGCHVISEYGAAEAGVLAISRDRTDNMATLWGTHLLTLDSERGCVVTTLNQRQFPLIQYALDDHVETTSVTPNGSVLAMSRVLGRTLDVLQLASDEGSIGISALQLTHMIKGHDSVRAVQFSQPQPDSITVHALLENPNAVDSVKRYLDVQLHRDYPGIHSEKISVAYSAEQRKSRAGKHLVIVDATSEDDSGNQHRTY